MSADSVDSGDSGRSPVLIWRGNVGLWIAARLARLKIVISRVAAVRAKRLAGGTSRIKTYKRKGCSRREKERRRESRKGESCESWWVERRWIKEPMNAEENKKICEFFFFFGRKRLWET